MIGKVDRQVKLTIVYAPNDRHDEAHQVVELAKGEQARFCNPKYWENSGMEPDARRVVILPGSPNIREILAEYQAAGIPAEVAGEAAPPAAPSPPGPATVAAVAPAPPPPASDAELEPWTGKISPGKYLERWPTAAKADLARQYVEAGKGG